MKPAARLADIEISLIRQINALATPLSLNLGIGEPNVEPDERLREMARRAVSSSPTACASCRAAPLSAAAPTSQKGWS